MNNWVCAWSPHSPCTDAHAHHYGRAELAPTPQTQATHREVESTREPQPPEPQLPTAHGLPAACHLPHPRTPRARLAPPPNRPSPICSRRVPAWSGSLMKSIPSLG
eukprot:scaffold25176_cov73-Isochrysis_galbana.AAC.2